MTIHQPKIKIKLCIRIIKIECIILHKKIMNYITLGPYCFLVTTSGAIQYGVPTIVVRFDCSGEICAQNPKSAAYQISKIYIETIKSNKYII